MKKIKKRTLPPCQVVATVHTVRGLHEAAELKARDGVSLVEIRLDCLDGKVAALPRTLAHIKRPLILTARHPREGGHGGLRDTQRVALLEPLLHRAAFVDVELRSARRLADTLRHTRSLGVETILSFHDFSRTPPVERLREKIREGRRLNASIIKIAVTLRSPRDLATLLLLQASGGGDVAVMGMGPLGKISRLVLPMVGARLVYGYLDRPQVGGQWPARVLAARLAEAGE